MTIENTSISGGRRPAGDSRRVGMRAVGGSSRYASCCFPRVPRAWSAPAPPADTPAKRRADRLLPRSGLSAVAYFAVVIGLLGIAQALPAPSYLIVDTAAFVAGGSWCVLNFWRSRQAHCLLTGPGWLLLALFTAAEAGHGSSLIGGDEQLVFLAVLALGLAFEAIWHLVRHTNAMTDAQTGPASGNTARR